MELYKEILAKVLEKEETHIIFPNLLGTVSEIVRLQCYQTLQKIKSIIENDSLSDFDCVEEIVCLFEQIGSDGGNRHDF